MKKIKIGLSGCGRISQKHFEALKSLEEFELVSVCDILVDRAKSASELTGAKVYNHYIDMITSEKLDCVTICTYPVSFSI